MSFSKKKEDTFSRYTDVTGTVSNRSLKLGEWYVSHKILLRNIFLVVFGIWCVISIGYSFFALVWYAVDGYFEDRSMLRARVLSLQRNNLSRNEYTATPLSFGNVQIFSPSPDLYDFVVSTENKNERSLAVVHYKFTFDGGETKTETMTVLPGKTIPLISLGNSFSDFPTNVKFVVVKKDFERIDAHRVSNIKNFIDSRLQFMTDEVVFTPPSEGLTSSKVEFFIQNNTVHNFWEIPFVAEIKSGSQTVGVFFFTVSDFVEGERRKIDVHTFFDVSFGDSLFVTPVFNVFDSSLYKR